jgi:hypothetical protein
MPASCELPLIPAGRYALTIGTGKEGSHGKFDFETYVFQVPLFFGACASHYQFLPQ